MNEEWQVQRLHAAMMAEVDSFRVALVREIADSVAVVVMLFQLLRERGCCLQGDR